MQLIYVMKDNSACSNCGLCTKHCPYHIDLNPCHNGRVESVDCTLCGECVAVCTSGSLKFGVSRNKQEKFWKYVPAALTVALVAFGMWAGGRFELPTIDMKWGLETVAEDGTVIRTLDPDDLQTLTIEGLRSIKCYGSSMTFKAQVEKVTGVHGVKTFVNRHSVEILYDPAKTTPEKIQEAIYTPAKFKVNTPDHKVTEFLKVVTIRTERMYDKLDISTLGTQMKLTGRKIYGLESEFSCPLIVRVIVDPSEELSEEWFKKVVETGTGYEFVEMQEGFTTVSTIDFIRNMFTPFDVQWKNRVEAAGENQQYVHEFVDKSYDDPMAVRYMPYLSNYLSKQDGVIGVSLALNDELQPCIRIRFAAPMTEERLWKLITKETWTITYSSDDIREEPAKFIFSTPGTTYPL
jgi:copper chaperone CopZ/NAD-dependent dihydropyrimidine dehydrogenase PreA subunit